MQDQIKEKIKPDEERNLEQMLQRVFSEWNPSKNCVKIQTIDAHTEGEPLRIIFSGYPKLSGSNVLDRRRDARDNWDHLRRFLMWEPRGHSDMYGCLIIPPNSTENKGEEEDEADFGVIFLHNEGYSSMCGHGIIAVTKVAIETGLVACVNPSNNGKGVSNRRIKIDAPAGRIIADATLDQEGYVSRVSFENVTSFVVSLDQSIIIEGLGKIQYDLAFGGAYYAYVDVNQFDFSLESKDVNKIIETGKLIKNAIMENVEIKHPAHDDLSFLYGTIFVGKPLVDTVKHHSRNVCVFAEGEVDRSPTGTGVSGRAAIQYSRGDLQMNQEIIIESILGTTFSVTPIKESQLGSYQGIVPKVSGTAFVTGKHEFTVDPRDPLEGFIFR